VPEDPKPRLSRRRFLSRGSVVAAAAGIGAAAPTAVGALLGASSAAPAAEDTADDLTASAADVDGVVVAHIRDLATGEIGVFNGTREVVFNDPQLVGRLLRALQ
jgi:nitrous oxide reductase